MNKLRNANNRVKGAFTGVGAAVMTALMMVMPAAADNIANQINGGLKKVYGILTAIVLPIAAIAVAVCAIKMIWGDQRSAEMAKGTLIRIVIGVALIFLAPFLVEQIKGWFNGTSANIW